MSSFKLKPYIELLENFLSGKITAHDFEGAYLDLFKNDATEWSEDEFAVLDELFADVDAFCEDPELRDERDLDENELRQKCGTALKKLKSLEGETQAPREVSHERSLPSLN